MNLFEITQKGVALGRDNAGTSSDRHLEIAYPANFHRNTILPDTVNYNPQWYSAAPFFVNAATSTSIPLAFKKVGTHVYLHGSIQNVRTTKQESTFMILPEVLRPTYTHYIIAPATGNNAANIGRVGIFVIYPSGLFKLYNTVHVTNEYQTQAANVGTYRFDIDTDYWAMSNEPLTSDNMMAPEFSYLYNLGQVNGLRLRGNGGISGLTTSQMQTAEGTNYIGVYNNGKSDSSGTGYAGFGYITTDGPIVVPVGKTVVKAELATLNNYSDSVTMRSALVVIDAQETTITRNSSSSSAQITFSGNYVNSICGSNINWKNSVYTAKTYYEFSLALPENFNYTRPIYIAINYRCSTDWRRDLRCRKLWLE